ncbi:MAG: ribosome biogenesis GTP-binding protein YihA/YsxC [Clostridiales Family XIII bacterium]|jgi:GTP-binding protein|nr:ribosome biogenesis GTP-binding protein YihA/YsxC [Clostridiales Family XIII bacterium]
MRIKKAELLAIAVKKSQYPEESGAEIAFAGRSNVGKSSLLNLLTGKKSLARISGSPGKTRTVNFYQINDEFHFVDLPGYGYAKVSRSVSESWGKMVESYLLERKTLRKVVLLVDIRHEPSAQDVQMYRWLRLYGLSGLVAATKADKISKNETRKNSGVIRKTLEMEENGLLIPVSALKKSGTDALMEAIEAIITPNETGSAGRRCIREEK